MLNPTAKDFVRLKSWHMQIDPFSAIKQFRRRHLWLRWLKPAHVYAYFLYWRKRRGMAAATVDMQKHYTMADMTLEKNRWEYLKLRKAWFIPPLHWDRFAEPDCVRILDVGCGDGDVTQRVVEVIEAEWRHGGAVHPIEIVGVDLNSSRIKNAQALCSSRYPEIKLSFLTADVVKDMPFPDEYFDYALCTGVLEILSDEPAAALIKNMCRVVKRGIYIEDLADRFPGGYPRDNMDEYFQPYGWGVSERHLQLTEPFFMLSIPDSCWTAMKWSMQKDQILWIEKNKQ